MKLGIQIVAGLLLNGDGYFFSGGTGREELVYQAFSPIIHHDSAFMNHYY
jgi:hypothetical protein